MGLLNRLGFKSKQEESKKSVKKVNIDMGSQGLITSESLSSKEEYYRDMYNKITAEDERVIKDIARRSQTTHEIFSRMEEYGIPLEYLVALGLTSEIDIESYYNVKEKGLDVKGVENSLEIDSTLQRQIESYKEELPEVRNDFAKEFKEQDEQDLYLTVTEEIEKGTENQEEIEPVNQLEIYPEEKVEKEEVKEDQSNEEDNEQESVNEKIRNLLNRYTNKEQEEVQDKEDNKESEEEKSKPKINLIDKRKIYVLGEDIEVPVIEGYELIKVTNFNQVNAFTSQRRDLLIITNKIPEDMQLPLVKWLQGVEKSSRKYRIATLTGNKIEHYLIETEIELTKESIDSYYHEYKDSYYEGDDVGSFHDLGNFFK